jgi:hypothetical protein
MNRDGRHLHVTLADLFWRIHCGRSVRRLSRIQPRKRWEHRGVNQRSKIGSYKQCSISARKLRTNLQVEFSYTMFTICVQGLFTHDFSGSFSQNHKQNILSMYTLSKLSIVFPHPGLCSTRKKFHFRTECAVQDRNEENSTQCKVKSVIHSFISSPT